MSLLKNTVALFNVIVIRLSLCPISFAAPLTPLVQQPGGQDSLQDFKLEQLNSSFPIFFGGFGALKDSNFPIMMIALFPPPDLDVKENDKEYLKGRFKRQSGAGKFSDASKMSSTKVMQLYLQMFRNLVSGAPVGGVHPMSKESAKPVVKLFKQRIISFFFPDVGEEKV